MPEQSYRLVFEGKIVEGYQCEQVKQNLSAFFKINGDRIEQMFSGKPITLKKNLDFSSANQFSQTLHKAGALCRIDPPHPAIKAKSPLRVIEFKPEKEDLRFSPKPCRLITGWENGIDLNRHDVKPVEFNDVLMASVVLEQPEKDNTLLFLLFIKGFPRPFSVDAGQIRYGDFFTTRHTSSVRKSLKNFTVFLLKKNPNLMIDQNTRDFINTEKLSLYGMSATANATGLAKALELNKGKRSDQVKQKSGTQMVDCPKCTYSFADSFQSSPQCPMCGTVVGEYVPEPSTIKLKGANNQANGDLSSLFDKEDEEESYRKSGGGAGCSFGVIPAGIAFATIKAWCLGSGMDEATAVIIAAVPSLIVWSVVNAMFSGN